MKALEDNTADICEICYNEIQYIDDCFCRKCGKKREIEDDLCLDCCVREHQFDVGRGVFVYEESIKKTLFGLKFFRQTWIGRKMGRVMAEYYLKEVGWGIDCVLPVPVHYTRYVIRGYNQAEILAMYFVKEYNRQMETYNGQKALYVPQGLRRKKWTTPQKNLSPETRYKNLENGFEVRRKWKKQIKGKTVLIIDDIYTTGATMDMCAKQLKEAGVKKVFFLVAAIGNGL